MRTHAARASDLKRAIDRLPIATRRAMLDGIDKNPIIVGADGDPRGGVCPIYATATPPSRRIGQPFARAWDRYAGSILPRPARERELRTLRTMLEASIERETEPVVVLHEAIAEHKASQARNRAIAPSDSPRQRPRDTGERDRTRELSRRHGWAWLRPFRNYDEYERALQLLDDLALENAPKSEYERFAGAAAGRG